MPFQGRVIAAIEVLFLILLVAGCLGICRWANRWEPLSIFKGTLLAGFALLLSGLLDLASLGIAFAEDSGSWQEWVGTNPWGYHVLLFPLIPCIWCNQILEPVLCLILRAGLLWILFLLLWRTHRYSHGSR